MSQYLPKKMRVLNSAIVNGIGAIGHVSGLLHLPAYTTAATMVISTRSSSEARCACTVVRAGASPAGSHDSHTSFSVTHDLAHARGYVNAFNLSRHSEASLSVF